MKTLAITKRIAQVIALLDAVRDRLCKARERPDDKMFLKIAQDEYDRVLSHYSTMVACLNAASGAGSELSGEFVFCACGSVFVFAVLFCVLCFLLAVLSICLLGLFLLRCRVMSFTLTSYN